MNAYEFLTEKNNGKTPDQMLKDGDFLGAKWVEILLDEYADIKAKTCNKQHVSGSLPMNMTIWEKARIMNYVEFCKWFNPRKGNDR